MCNTHSVTLDYHKDISIEFSLNGEYLALYNGKVLKVFKLLKNSKKEDGFNLKKLISTIQEDLYYMKVEDDGKHETYVIPLSQHLLDQREDEAVHVGNG